MDILFDEKALQAHVHKHSYPEQPAGIRLSQLLRGLQSDLSATVNIEELTADRLDKHDVLAIPTRRPQASFSTNELAQIRTFVENANGLLLFTNHGRDRNLRDDVRAEDKRLAQEFGIRIPNAVFSGNPHTHGVLERGLFRNHPIVDGGSQQRKVNRIGFNNSGCLVRGSTDVEPIVSLPVFTDTEQAYFCLTTEVQNGRVAVVADSGFLGSENPQGKDVPGPGGFIDRFDNQQFVLNVFRWAAGQLG